MEEEGEVGVVVGVTAEVLPRATRAVSIEVMFIISLDASWNSKAEAVVEVEGEAVVVGAVMVRERRQEARTQRVPLFSLYRLVRHSALETK